MVSTDSVKKTERPAMYSFIALVDKIIAKYEKKKKCKRKKERNYILKLLELIQYKSRPCINQCLHYIEEKVISVDGGHWVPLLWTYCRLLHSRVYRYLDLRRTKKLFFKFCVEQRTSTLEELHAQMVMHAYATHLIPVPSSRRNPHIMMEPKWLGKFKLDDARQAVTVTMGQMMLRKARTFSPGQIELKELEDVVTAAYGDKPINPNKYFEDFYPPESEEDIFQAFVKENSAFKEQFKAGLSLKEVPGMIDKLVNFIVASLKKENNKLVSFLMELTNQKNLCVEEALARLWVFVGVVHRRRWQEGDEFTMELGEAIFNLFQAAQEQDADKNMSHLVIIRKEMQDLFPQRTFPDMKSTYSILKKHYPNLDVQQTITNCRHMGPEHFFEVMSRRSHSITARDDRLEQKDKWQDTDFCPTAVGLCPTAVGLKSVSHLGPANFCAMTSHCTNSEGIAAQGKELEITGKKKKERRKKIVKVGEGVQSPMPILPTASHESSPEQNVLTNYHEHLKAFRNAIGNFRGRFKVFGSFPSEIAKLVKASLSFIGSLNCTILEVINELGRDSSKLSVEDSLAFLWVFVGIAMHKGLTNVYKSDDVSDLSLGCGFRNLFDRAIKKDAFNLIKHITHLWTRIRQTHDPRVLSLSRTLLTNAFPDRDWDSLVKEPKSSTYFFNRMQKRDKNLTKLATQTVTRKLAKPGLQKDANVAPATSTKSTPPTSHQNELDEMPRSKQARLRFGFFKLAKRDFHERLHAGSVSLKEIPSEIEKLVLLGIAYFESEEEQAATAKLIAELELDHDTLDADEALALLWVYVGVADRMRLYYHVSEDVGIGILKLFTACWKPAVPKLDRKWNRKHLSHMWNWICKVHSPESLFRCHKFLLQIIPHLHRYTSASYTASDMFNILHSRQETREINMAKIQPPVKVETPPEITGPPSKVVSQDGSYSKLKLKSKQNPSASIPVHNKSDLDDSPQLCTEENEAASTPTTLVLRTSTNHAHPPRMNPSLFPSDDVSWSDKSILSKKRKRKDERAMDLDFGVQQQDSTAAEIHVPCKQIILDLNYTQEDYVEHILAPNYYYQSVEQIDGHCRVVIYHKLKVDIS